MNLDPQPTFEIVPLTRIHERVYENAIEYENPYPNATPIFELERKAINWESQEDMSVVQVGQNYIVHSRPAFYRFADQKLKVVDICIVSENLSIATESFKQRKAESDRIKTERSAQIEPFVKEISQIPGIQLITGRGTVYDERRIANITDDIDVSIFFKADSLVEFEKMIAMLNEVSKKIAAQLKVDIERIDFTSDNLSAEAKEIVSQSDSKYTISFDLINLLILQNPNSRSDGQKDRYYVDIVKQMKFLGGSPKILDLIKAALKIS